jgi:hypothetical protein
MSKTRLYIGTDLLDFTGLINVKRQVNDFRDPSIGSSNKSYTIDIPLTPTNKRLLGYVNDIRSRQEVTSQARLTVDNMEVIRGTLRIMSLNSLYVKAIIEADTWIDDISGTSIKDLSWAGGDEHDFTSANIVASWTAAAGAFYRYPLINFCELNSGGYGIGGSAVYPWEFYPMWNVEDIVTKVLLDAGYTLAAGSFFATTQGRAMYLLSAPVPLPDDFITGKALDVYINDNSDNYSISSSIASAAIGGNTMSTFVVDIDGETEDEGADFNTSTNRYVVPADGTYRFQAQLNIYSTQHRTTLWTITSSALNWQIRKNGSTTIESFSTTATDCFDSGNNVYTLDTGYVHLEAGDYIEIFITTLSSNAQNDDPSPRTAELFITAGATTSFLKLDWSEQNLWPGLGKTMSPAEYLPDIDGLDLLVALKQVANLRFFVDQLNKKIYIETSDDFYDYGTALTDWSDRIDYSEELELEVIAASYKRTNILQYKPDSGDKAYTNEVSANGVPFKKDIVLTSQYAQPGVTEWTNEQFAPTVLGDMPQVGHWGGLVPRIFGSQEFVSSARPYPAARAKSWEPRLLEWKGMTAFGSGGNFDYYEDIEDASASNYTTFPSAETMDMSDMYDAYHLKDWNKINKNKIATPTLKISPADLTKFITVVGSAPWEEGFRAKYKLNIEGVGMVFICSQIVADGDRVKGEFIQNM